MERQVITIFHKSLFLHKTQIGFSYNLVLHLLYLTYHMHTHVSVCSQYMQVWLYVFTCGCEDQKSISILMSSSIFEMASNIGVVVWLANEYHGFYPPVSISKGQGLHVHTTVLGFSYRSWESNISLLIWSSLTTQCRYFLSLF